MPRKSNRQRLLIFLCVTNLILSISILVSQNLQSHVTTTLSFLSLISTLVILLVIGETSFRIKDNYDDYSDNSDHGKEIERTLPTYTYSPSSSSGSAPQDHLPHQLSTLTNKRTNTTSTFANSSLKVITKTFVPPLTLPFLPSGASALHPLPHTLNEKVSELTRLPFLKKPSIILEDETVVINKNSRNLSIDVKNLESYSSINLQKPKLSITPPPPHKIHPLPSRKQPHPPSIVTKSSSQSSTAAPLLKRLQAIDYFGSSTSNSNSTLSLSLTSSMLNKSVSEDLIKSRIEDGNDKDINDIVKE